MTTPAAPVAPATPAPAPAAPASGFELNPVQRVVQEVRDRIASGGGLMPAATPTSPTEGAALPALDAQLGSPAPVAPAPEPAPVELDAFGEPVAPPPGEAAPAPEGEAPPEGEEPPVDEALLVTLPARRPGETELSVVVDDPVVAERMRQMRNGYMRGEEAREVHREAEQVLSEAEEVQAHIAVDPIAFVHQHLRPEFRAELALAVLTDPELWPAMQETLAGLVESPERVEMVRADLNARRYQFKEAAQAQLATEREMKANARQVNSALERLVPPALKGEPARLFVEDCRRVVGDYAEQHRLRTIDPLHLPMILAPRLRAYGVDPVLAAQRLSGPSVPSRPPAAPSAAPARRAPGAPTPEPPTGQAFVAASQARRAVAAIAPAGAGSPAGGLVPPPKGVGIKEAIAHARQHGVRPGR